MARLTEPELAVLRGLIEEEPAHGPGMFRFPHAVEREDYRLGLITQRYLRYEATPGYVTCGDAFVPIIEFSGIPDSIEIWVLDQDVLVQFINDRGSSNESIQVNAGNFYEPGICYQDVLARNAVVGLNARIQVVAKWVSR